MGEAGLLTTTGAGPGAAATVRVTAAPGAPTPTPTPTTGRVVATVLLLEEAAGILTGVEGLI